MGHDVTVDPEDRCTTPQKRGWEGSSSSPDTGVLSDGRLPPGTCDDDRVYVQSRRSLDSSVYTDEIQVSPVHSGEHQVSPDRSGEHQVSSVYSDERIIIGLAATPSGEWLGSEADEGRAKLR